MKIRRHPAKSALLAYAENLVDNRTGIDRSIAAHLSQCPACQAEVRAMQASMAFAASAPELEPGGDLTAQILMAGKQARVEMGRRNTPLRAALKVAQGLACAAGMVLVAGVTFAAFVGSPEQDTPLPVLESEIPMVAVGDQSPEAMRKAAMEVAEEVRTLSAAIKSQSVNSQNPQDLERMRVVLSRDGDVAAALSAIERNPSNNRATQVLQTYLKDLRSIYVEGGSL